MMAAVLIVDDNPICIDPINVTGAPIGLMTIRTVLFTGACKINTTGQRKSSGATETHVIDI